MLGVLYALMQHDIKRLLAYHSIENIGIILIGLGSALLLQANGAHASWPPWRSPRRSSTRSTTRSSRACSSSGPGAVIRATGLHDLNHLGGLGRKMPVTMLAFGVGAAAISGLPPLNGFASEWLTFQGLLGAARQRRPGAARPVRRRRHDRRPGPDRGAGRGLLRQGDRRHVPGAAAQRRRGRGRTRRRDRPGRRWRCWRSPCLGSGPRGRARRGGTHRRGPHDARPGRPARPLAAVAAVTSCAAHRRARPRTRRWRSGLLLALAAVGVALAGRGRGGPGPPGRHVDLRHRPRSRRSSTPPTSYSKPIRLFFRRILLPEREVQVEYHAGTAFPSSIRYRSEITLILEDRFFRPAHGLSLRAADFARRLQGGAIQLYIAYSVVAVLVLLLLAR